MPNEITVYKKLISSTDMLISVVKNEIGIKACIPFAVRAQEALLGLGDKITESEARKAANTFLDNLQTLTQGGITTEDYDKIDFVKRGKTICISARAEACLRAAARKGYRITDTIIAVPKQDAATTYFEENFYQGDIVYTLKDKRANGDRKITVDRLVSDYFDKFICRLEVTDIKANKRLLMTICEMSNEEILAAAAASDNGIYKSKWESYTDDWNNQKKRKVITKELNAGSIWNVWTAEMVNKSILRRALKKVREILPELTNTILAFDTDVPQEETTQQNESAPQISVPALNAAYIDIFNLSEKQQAEANEMLEVYKANPKLAEEHANEIVALYDKETPIKIICNERYAEIVGIRQFTKIQKDSPARPLIVKFMKVAKAESEAEDETD